jgi:predicted KAP-like P-loop ATPase
MLRKHTDLEIDPSAPFANDCLNRRPQIETLTRLVQPTTQPFGISVEAPWGRGKTTFLRMWKAHLESKGHLCLHFNAWENDFVDDPLTAFVGEMEGGLTEVLGEVDGESAVRKRWAAFRSLGGGILRKTLPLAVQVATQGLLSQQTITNAIGSLAESSDDIADFLAKAAEDRLQSYKAEKQGIAAFRSNLVGLASDIVKEGKRKARVVFFIDELGRCRPDFAIALLERVKHLFSVAGIVFVLGIDRGQLAHSVRALYGTGMDADGYLRRFIDLVFTLPPPDARAFCQFLFNRFELE